MSLLRPGGLALTEYALKMAGAKEGMDLLDIGCGNGDAAAFAKDELKLNVKAVDTNTDCIEKAKALGVDAKINDACMLDFMSKSFDIVMMECTFSQLGRQEESFHEAYCMLRPGGRLIISDLYCKEPDLARWEADYKASMAIWRRPRKEADCQTEELPPSPYMQDGAMVMQGIKLLSDELEMKEVLFEDRTDDLKEMVGQAIFDYGSVEKWNEAMGGCALLEAPKGNTGYFLLILEKNA